MWESNPYSIKLKKDRRPLIYLAKSSDEDGTSHQICQLRLDKIHRQEVGISLLKQVALELQRGATDPYEVRDRLLGENGGDAKSSQQSTSTGT